MLVRPASCGSQALDFVHSWMLYCLALDTNRSFIKLFVCWDLADCFSARWLAEIVAPIRKHGNLLLCTLLIGNTVANCAPPLCLHLRLQVFKVSSSLGRCLGCPVPRAAECTCELRGAHARSLPVHSAVQRDNRHRGAADIHRAAGRVCGDHPAVHLLAPWPAPGRLHLLAH